MQDFPSLTEWEAAMRRGDWTAAWRINDAVLASRDPATRDDPARPYHERWVWDGTPPDGQDVLVRCYHGLGDTLQFSRYLPLIAARAASLRVEVQPELLEFLRRRPGLGELIAFDPAHPLPPAPCTLEIMELAHVLRQPPPPISGWRIPPNGHPAPVGICTDAGGWDEQRSVPHRCLAPLVELAGIEWIPLQRTPGPFGPPLDPVADIAATADLMFERACCVVTVDTMIAHLAGTLGVHAFVLLKSHADWRWADQDAGTPWYPAMTLCRQPAPGDWATPIGQVRDELARLCR